MEERNDEPGRWLVEHRAELDRAEALWLERLAEFDRSGAWALDGHLSCVSWLCWNTGMGRSTAFEKLRVGHELSRRPVIADAFKRGDLSYSAVRALTRMDRPDPEVDAALVELATSRRGNISDLEKVVRSYMLYADQERPPAEDPLPVRDVSLRRDQDGSGKVSISLSPLEFEEFAVTLQAFTDMRYRRQGVDESSAEDTGRAGEAPLEEASRAARKADAFMDLVSTALAGADGGHAAGDDRYMIHLVAREGGPVVTYADGTPVAPGEAAFMACDCSTVAHLTTEGGEPLSLGRRSREWSTAQRRAIMVRDGGRCRFPGCGHRRVDIHHMLPWEAGGGTDVANGMSECRRHHRMLHAGYRVVGDPGGELRFFRPDSTYIGSTYPAAARTPVLAGR